MEKLLNKFLSPVLLGLSAILILIAVFMGTTSTQKLNPEVIINNKPLTTGVANSTELFLYVSYIFIFLVIAAILIGAIVGIITDFKSSMRALIGIGATVILFLILYYGFATPTIASHGSVMPDGTKFDAYKAYKVTNSIVNFVDASLMLIYVMSIIAVIGVLATELKGALK
jgi:hypothetical protein